MLFGSAAAAGGPRCLLLRPHCAAAASSANSFLPLTAARPAWRWPVRLQQGEGPVS